MLTPRKMFFTPYVQFQDAGLLLQRTTLKLKGKFQGSPVTALYGTAFQRCSPALANFPSPHRSPADLESVWHLRVEIQHEDSEGSPWKKKLDSEAEHYPLIFFDMQSSCAGGEKSEV